MSDNPVAMSLLKANLGFFDAPIDAALTAWLDSRLAVAEHELTTICNIQLTDGVVADEDLKAMYAAWLYRKSVTGEAKPPMLQLAIRNRQVNAPLPEEDTP